MKWEWDYVVLPIIFNSYAYVVTFFLVTARLAIEGNPFSLFWLPHPYGYLISIFLICLYGLFLKIVGLGKSKFRFALTFITLFDACRDSYILLTVM